MVFRKKLLIVGSTQGCYGGIEAFMLTIAKEALKWEEFEVKLCFKIVNGYSFQNDLLSCVGVNSLDVSFVERGSLEILRLIVWADIIHAQNAPPDVVFLGRIFLKKIFLTVHNRRMQVKSFHRLLWDISVKLAHNRWYNSNFVWNSWEPAKKSTRSVCIPTVSNLPTSWCPPQSRKGFLFVGRWIPNKGIEEIVNAYALCNFDPIKWPLVLLGDGPMKNNVFNLIKRLNLVGVRTPGFVDETAKAGYIASTRWLLAPAKTLEDLGLTPIEARNVGVPSIVTRDGGLPESGGPTALIAEPGNVDDLARCMHIAAEMDEDEYRIRGEISKSSLSEFLKPLTFYRQAYNGLVIYNTKNKYVENKLN